MIHVGGYHEYIGGCSVHWGDTMSTLGDIMSTSGDVQYIGVFNRISNILSSCSPTCIMVSHMYHGIPHSSWYPSMYS